MRIFLTVIVLWLSLSLIVFGQQFTKAPKLPIDKGGGTKVSVSTSKIQSTNAASVLIGKAWNALTSLGTYTNQISYDPYTNLIAVVHRTDRTAGPDKGGLIVYRVSDDDGANFNQQRGPVNPTIGGYGATMGRMPNLALVNPTKSSNPANAIVSITYNNLIPSGDAFRDVVFVKDVGFDGNPDAFQVDSSDIFAYASAVDLNNGIVYSLLSGNKTYDYDVAKSTNSGATWTKVRVFNNADAEYENGLNGGWLDVDNNGNVHLVLEGKIRTAPDTLAYYFRYQKSTNAGATWSTPSYVGASVAGCQEIAYQFDCIMDANEVLHIGAVLIDTIPVPDTYALYDITRSTGGIWSATKISDIREPGFNFPTDTPPLYTLSEPQFSKSVDGQTIAIKWVDIKENPTVADTLPDIFTTAKRASGVSWGAIRNITNTPLVCESFTKSARNLKNDGTLMIMYTIFGAKDLDEAFLYYLGDGVVVGVGGDIVSIPKKFSMEQNYPNPFNPSTEIKYTLSSKSMVTLKVYNVIGQEVATLVNAQMNAGEHAVRFNASKLSSGIYIYKLQAGSFTDVKKMALIK